MGLGPIVMAAFKAVIVYFETELMSQRVTEGEGRIGRTAFQSQLLSFAGHTGAVTLCFQRFLVISTALGIVSTALMPSAGGVCLIFSVQAHPVTSRGKESSACESAG